MAVAAAPDYRNSMRDSGNTVVTFRLPVTETLVPTGRFINSIFGRDLATRPTEKFNKYDEILTPAQETTDNIFESGSFTREAVQQAQVGLSLPKNSGTLAQNDRGRAIKRFNTSMNYLFKPQPDWRDLKGMAYTAMYATFGNLLENSKGRRFQTLQSETTRTQYIRPGIDPPNRSPQFSYHATSAVRQFLDQANLQLLEAYPSEQIIAADGAEAYVNFRRLQTIIYDLPIVVRPPTADSPNAASINANTPYRGHYWDGQGAWIEYNEEVAGGPRRDLPSEGRIFEEEVALLMHYAMFAYGLRAKPVHGAGNVFQTYRHSTSDNTVTRELLMHLAQFIIPLTDSSAGIGDPTAPYMFENQRNRYNARWMMMDDSHIISTSNIFNHHLNQTILRPEVHAPLFITIYFRENAGVALADTRRGNWFVQPTQNQILQQAARNAADIVPIINPAQFHIGNPNNLAVNTVYYVPSGYMSMRKLEDRNNRSNSMLGLFGSIYEQLMDVNSPHSGRFVFSGKAGFRPTIADAYGITILVYKRASLITPYEVYGKVGLRAPNQQVQAIIRRNNSWYIPSAGTFRWMMFAVVLHAARFAQRQITANLIYLIWPGAAGIISFFKWIMMALDFVSWMIRIILRIAPTINNIKMYVLGPALILGICELYTAIMDYLGAGGEQRARVDHIYRLTKTALEYLDSGVEYANLAFEKLKDLFNQVWPQIESIAETIHSWIGEGPLFEGEDGIGTRILKIFTSVTVATAAAKAFGIVTYYAAIRPLVTRIRNLYFSEDARKRGVWNLPLLTVGSVLFGNTIKKQDIENMRNYELDYNAIGSLTSQNKTVESTAVLPDNAVSMRTFFNYMRHKIVQENVTDNEMTRINPFLSQERLISNAWPPRKNPNYPSLEGKTSYGTEIQNFAKLLKHHNQTRELTLEDVIDYTRRSNFGGAVANEINLCYNHESLSKNDTLSSGNKSTWMAVGFNTISKHEGAFMNDMFFSDIVKALVNKEHHPTVFAIAQFGVGALLAVGTIAAVLNAPSTFEWGYLNIAAPPPTSVIHSLTESNNNNNEMNITYPDPNPNNRHMPPMLLAPGVAPNDMVDEDGLPATQLQNLNDPNIMNMSSARNYTMYNELLAEKSVRYPSTFLLRYMTSTPLAYTFSFL